VIAVAALLLLPIEDMAAPMRPRPKGHQPAAAASIGLAAVCWKAIQETMPTKQKNNKTTKLSVWREAASAAVCCPLLLKIVAAVAHHPCPAVAVLAGRCGPVWGCW